MSHIPLTPERRAQLEASIASINEAIGLGARQVQYGDKMITYTSLSDMIRARRLLEDELYPPESAFGLFGRRTTVGDFNSGK